MCNLFTPDFSWICHGSYLYRVCRRTMHLSSVLFLYLWAETFSRNLNYLKWYESLEGHTFVITVIHRDTWLFCLVSLSASSYIFLSPCQTPFFSLCLSVCIKLQIASFFFFLPSLSQSEPNVSLCLHPFPSLYIFPSLAVPAASDFRYFQPFLSLASRLFVSLFLLHLFLGLSISICLSGQFGFSQGCTLTRWNGVSLFLRWWRHFAVRITALDIDRKETWDFRGHHEQAGKRDRAPNQHTHQLQVEENADHWG